jgi:hypothetical protein
VKYGTNNIQFNYTPTDSNHFPYISLLIYTFYYILLHLKKILLRIQDVSNHFTYLVLSIYIIAQSSNKFSSFFKLKKHRLFLLLQYTLLLSYGT